MPWSTDEKLTLLEALQKYGASNIEKIAEDLPFKSITEVRNAILKYKKKATESLQNEKEEASSSNALQNAPVDEWIQVLERNTSNKTQIPPISRVFKYIALFEDHESNSNSNETESQVNLSDCYEVLSDQLRGATPKTLTGDTLQFFNETLVKMAAEVSKENTEQEKEFLKNLQINDISAFVKKPKTYSRKMTHNE